MENPGTSSPMPGIAAVPVRRLLAIAVVYDGMSQAEAARLSEEQEAELAAFDAARPLSGS